MVRSLVHTLVLTATLVTGTLAAAARADMAAVGDGEHLWIVRPVIKDQKQKQDAVTILHRHRSQEHGVIRRVAQLPAKLKAGGITAGAGRLWLAYDNPQRSVQSLKASQDPRTDQWRFPARIEPALPTDTELRAFAANVDGPWALCRVTTIEALDAIDHPPALELDDDDDVLPSNPQGEPEPDADAPAEAADGAGADSPGPDDAGPVIAAREPGQTVPADRLIHLSRTGWKAVDLPADWSLAGNALLAAGSDDKPPALIHVLRHDGHVTLTAYFLESGAWQAAPPVTFDRAEAIQADVVQYTVVARRVTGDEAGEELAVELVVMRPDGESVLGTITVADPAPTAWSLVTGESDHAAIVTEDADGKLRIAHIGLRDGKVTTAAPLREQPPMLLPLDPDNLVLIGVMAVAMFIMILSWKRDPAWNRLELPKEIVFASLGRRGFAGLIDLAPCLAAVMVVYDIMPEELVSHWPGWHAGTWENMVPAAIAGGLFVAHSLLTELFTGRSLGKALMGLKVADLKGQPPNAWQVVGRNALKLFELIAWPLLLMPGLSPYRQRIGDLVARTIVVMPRPEDMPADDDEDVE